MVPTPVLRRAAALALTAALTVAGTALADTVAADGDTVTPGNQAALDLGEVAPGASLTLDVTLRLTCRNATHALAGSVIAVSDAAVTVPDDGRLSVTPGRITVPATWPAPGEGCPTGIAPVPGDVPVTLSLTAPTTPGPGRFYDVLFALEPADGVTNPVAFSVSLDVVEPLPVDTTAPVLSGLPTDLVVFTAGLDAIVAWPMPTAVDDTDPSLAVACTPEIGSAFPVGTTRVACTATDAAGNVARGVFDVTVRRLFATWDQPLGDGIPALTGQSGRTIPLKLDIRSGDAVQGPADVAAPGLVAERLDGCSPDGPVLEAREAGAFHWDNGRWRLNLATGGLDAGCWRLSAVLDGTPLAIAIVDLVADGRAG